MLFMFCLSFDVCCWLREIVSGSVVEAGRVEAVSSAGRWGRRFGVGRRAAAVNELEDFGSVFVHGGESGAEEAVESLLGGDASG